MKATVADLAALLRASSAPKLLGASQVWRLDGTDRQAESLRESFLALAARFPTVFAQKGSGLALTLIT